MTATHTDVTEAERIDIDADFVSRRSVEVSDGQLVRLLVKDEAGTQFAILQTPDTTPRGGFETGATYRFVGMIGADPVPSEGNVDVDCPACESPLRRGQAVDTISSSVTLTTEAFDLADTFGILDSESSIYRVRGDDAAVDNWVPRQESDRVETPEFVCDTCGHHPEPRELEGQTGADGILDANRTVDPAPANFNDSVAAETVGLATGGAKDVANFRDNVENGYTPQPEAISDEGLFYDYYFETGGPTDTDALFAPRYATAASEHPLTGETERYLSVGLDSTLSVADFERPRLDLVAVLDVSGSMSGAFDGYYYDEQGQRREADADDTTKLDAAIQSLCALTEHLAEDDRLGVVLYDQRAHIAKPLRDVGSTDMYAIRRHIRDITAGGGTNLEAGFDAAVDLLEGTDADADVERRVVFTTDMMPNTGATAESALTGRIADAAERGIHTTFVGIGLDANAALADSLSSVRGANHYFVQSAEEFERRLGEEFAYMVTPLVYDLSLELEADGYEIEAVHGSPTADDATGRLLDVGTLFPSAKEDGEARGGVVLVRLERVGSDPEAALVASWTERDGGEHTQRVGVDLPDSPEYYQHDGIRKAIVLARYARVLRKWARAVHGRSDPETAVDDWQARDDLGRQERESVSLAVPRHFADRFEQLREYLATEMFDLGDDTLEQELDLLTTLVQAAPASECEVTE